MKQLQGFSAGKLAKAAGVNVETLRYYEKRRLLPEPPRKPSGYRIYPPMTIDRLHFIKGAQSLGFTLEEIRNLLDLRVDEHAHRTDVRHYAREKVVDIERKIQALQAIKGALYDLIEQCHGDGPVADCPILEALPQASLGLHPQPEPQQ